MAVRKSSKRSSSKRGKANRRSSKSTGRKRKASGSKSLRVVKGGKSSSGKKKFDATKFYKKYPWVVSGSVKEVKPNSVVDGVKAVHGRICKIKCQETGKLRTINVQDAFQTKYTKEVQQRRARERAAQRRKKKSKKKAG